MGYMFCDASSFGQTLCWDISNVYDLTSPIFNGSNGAQFSPIAYPDCLL
jgi:hypothetical protein